MFCRNLIGCSENIYHNKLKHFVSTTLMIMFLKRKLNTEEWAWKSEEKNIFEKNFWRSFCIMIVIFSTRLAWELFLTNSYLKKEQTKYEIYWFFAKKWSSEWYFLWYILEFLVHVELNDEFFNWLCKPNDKLKEILLIFISKWPLPTNEPFLKSVIKIHNVL